MSVMIAKNLPKTSELEAGLQQAITQGVLKELPPAQDLPPWSTLALTFTGALVSAIFFLICLGLILSEIGMMEAGVFYVLAVGFIVASLVFLRTKSNHGLFMEHLMFIALVVGLVLLAIALCFDLFKSDQELSASTVLLIMIFVVAVCTFLVPMAWARAFLAFATAYLLYTYYIVNSYTTYDEWDEGTAAGLFSIIAEIKTYLTVLLVPFVSVVLLFTARRLERKALWKQSLFFEPILNGWLVGTFLILIYAAGNSIFLSAFVEIPQSLSMAYENITSSNLFFGYIKSPLAWIQILSLPLAWVWAAKQCALLKSTRVLALVFALTVFSLIVPKLALCLALSLLTYVSGRYKITILGTLCALWILGTLYYMLAMPLANKAIWLAAMGAVLLVIALVGSRPPTDEAEKKIKTQDLQQARPFAAKPIVSLVLLAIAATAIFGGVNMSVWKQEQVRSQGMQVLIPLAPVDPRSIMQGDYMILNFSLPSDIQNSKDGAAYLRVDAQGVATFIPEKERSNERRFNLQKQGNTWHISANAWFFEEGDAERWEAAKYGIFKVDAAGNSSLIGLADGELNPIGGEGKAGVAESVVEE